MLLPRNPSRFFPGCFLIETRVWYAWQRFKAADISHRQYFLIKNKDFKTSEKLADFPSNHYLTKETAIWCKLAARNYWLRKCFVSSGTIFGQINCYLKSHPALESKFKTHRTNKYFIACAWRLSISLADVPLKSRSPARHVWLLLLVLILIPLKNERQRIAYL